LTAAGDILIVLAADDPKGWPFHVCSVDDTEDAQLKPGEFTVQWMAASSLLGVYELAWDAKNCMNPMLNDIEQSTILFNLGPDGLTEEGRIPPDTVAELRRDGFVPGWAIAEI
jgi:hypothetical protein